jgi:hypothetical protein
MYKRIILACDGSAGGQKALPDIKDLAHWDHPPIDPSGNCSLCSCRVVRGRKRGCSCLPQGQPKSQLRGPDAFSFIATLLLAGPAGPDSLLGICFI